MQCSAVRNRDCTQSAVQCSAVHNRDSTQSISNQADSDHRKNTSASSCQFALLSKPSMAIKNTHIFVLGTWEVGMESTVASNIITGQGQNSSLRGFGNVPTVPDKNLQDGTILFSLHVYNCNCTFIRHRRERERERESVCVCVCVRACVVWCAHEY